MRPGLVLVRYPFTDIVVHKIETYSPQIDSLIREIVDLPGGKDASIGAIGELGKQTSDGYSSSNVVGSQTDPRETRLKSTLSRWRIR